MFHMTVLHICRMKLKILKKAVNFKSSNHKCYMKFQKFISFCDYKKFEKMLVQWTLNAIKIINATAHIQVLNSF